MDVEDIFAYSRLRRRACSSKTEIYQIPLLGSCLPSECTESLRADRKRKPSLRRLRGEASTEPWVLDCCPPKYIHVASTQQISALSGSEKCKVGKGRAVTRQDIHLSGADIGCLKRSEAVWSWFLHHAAYGELPVAGSEDLINPE